MKRIRRLAYGWRLWKGYMRIGFLKMTQYPADTSIWLVSMLIREASGFIGILAIAPEKSNIFAPTFVQMQYATIVHIAVREVPSSPSGGNGMFNAFAITPTTPHGLINSMNTPVYATAEMILGK